jgi:hypothetical protein
LSRLRLTKSSSLSTASDATPEKIEWIYANGPIRVIQKNGEEIVMPALKYMTLKERLQAAKETNGAA